MHLTTYFFSSFRDYKSRYLACIIGFGVALGAVFAVNAYTTLLDDTVKDFYLLDENSFMVIAKGSNVIQIIPYESQIPENVSEALSDQEGIVFSFPMIFRELSNSSQFKYFKDTLVGIDTDLLEDFYLANANLKSGRYAERNQDEVVIGNQVGGGEVEVGDQMAIYNRSFTIVGILESKNPLLDHFTFLHFPIAQEVCQMEKQCNAIFAFTDKKIFEEVTSLPQLEEKMAQTFPMINIVDEEELNAALGMFYRILDLLSGVISSFPLVISGFFILVMMILNVKDQEREFGMLRAIGMPLPKIGTLVFFQSIFIGTCGYLLSLLIGNLYFLYGFYVFNRENSTWSIWDYVQNLRNQIPVKSYWITFILSLFIAILIAIYPVYRSTKKSIVETFRKEE